MSESYHGPRYEEAFPSKTCTKCGPLVGPQPMDAFPGDRMRIDGRSSWCRTCHNQANLARYVAKHPPKVHAEKAPKTASRRPKPPTATPEGMKWCFRCSPIRGFFPLSDFALSRSTKDGHFTYCRQCCRERWRERHPAPPVKTAEERMERRTEMSRKWRHEHPELVAEYRRRRRESERKKDRQRWEEGKHWTQRHREEKRCYDADRYLRQQIEVAERARQWQREHPQRYREIVRKYRAGNGRLKTTEYAQLRRVRKLGTQVEIVDYAAILAVHGRVCYLCGLPIPEGRRQLHFDHVVPLARGGTHTEDNIRPTHARCNYRKGKKLLAEIDQAAFNDPFIGVHDEQGLTGTGLRPHLFQGVLISTDERTI